MGLVIGGKDFEHEQETIPRMNVIVCTPGRLLQHMDETEGFDCTNLQMLVLDEADRILDMGFAKTLNAILENIPKARQTLLFSATQTKSVRDLARLSLNVIQSFVSLTKRNPNIFQFMKKLKLQHPRSWSSMSSFANFQTNSTLSGRLSKLT